MTYSSSSESKIPNFISKLLKIKNSSFIQNFRDFFLFKIVTPSDLITSIVLGSLSGIGIIIAINAGSSFFNNFNSSLITALIFLVLLWINKTTQTSLLETCVAAVEIHLEEIRSHVAKTLTDIEFSSIEAIAKNYLMSGLTRHYDVVNNGVVPLASAARSIPLVLLLFLYLSYISWISALILFITCVICANVYISKLHILRHNLSEMYISESSLLGLIQELFEGFVELKYSDLKKTQLADNLRLAIEKSVASRLESTNITIGLITLTGMINYLFAGSIVFLLPLISGHNSLDLGKIVAISLFTIGPIASLIDGIQNYELVRFSYKSIIDFKDTIDCLMCNKSISQDQSNLTINTLNNFQSIRATNVTFSRKAPDGKVSFTVGPVNLSLEPGKLIIVEGGNGSGKTTFIRLITGLYNADTGVIFFNEEPITPDNISAYRQNFGVITSDYHVFKKFYGMDQSMLNAFNNHTRELNIQKCSIKNINDDLIVDELSTGQRKRLALAVTLTEDKPVLIFDEWAADQDPFFREKFYREILPNLKKKNKALLVVSHDDRYFDIADERYHMQDGKLSRVIRRRNTSVGKK